MRLRGVLGDVGGVFGKSLGGFGEALGGFQSLSSPRAFSSSPIYEKIISSRSTALAAPYCNITILQYYHITILLYCNITIFPDA